MTLPVFTGSCFGADDQIGLRSRWAGLAGAAGTLYQNGLFCASGGDKTSPLVRPNLLVEGVGLLFSARCCGVTGDQSISSSYWSCCARFVGVSDRPIPPKAGCRLLCGRRGLNGDWGDGLWSGIDGFWGVAFAESRASFTSSENVFESSSGRRVGDLASFRTSGLLYVANRGVVSTRMDLPANA